jgi:hypothetical protein
MAKTFNPQRVGGGTFSLVRDSQGNYSLKETGFDKVVSLPMIELGQTAQTTTAQQTKTASQLTGQTAQALTSGATTSGARTGGGGSGAFQFTDVSPYKLQQQGEDVSKRLTQSQVDSNRDFMMGMGGKTDTSAPFPGRSRITPTTPDADTGALGLADMDTTKTLDIKDTSEALDKPFKGTGTMTTSQRSKLTGGTRVGPGTIKSRMAAERDTDIGTMDTGTLGISSDQAKTQSQGPSDPRFRDQALGISAQTQVADQDLEADAGTQAQLGIKKAPTAVDQLKATGTQIKKTADSILQPGASVKIIGQAIGGVLKAISPEPSVMDKFKTGYFKTAGDLGSSTDPGRIVGNPQTNVFAGMNRNSAFGNLGQSGQNRVDRVAGYAAKNRAKAEAARKAGNIAKAKKYEEKAKRQEDKARTFQNQVNKYNSDKNTELEKKRKEKAQNPNLRAGADSGPGGGRDSGKIVCTMMNESYGFGSFRNKIWMKFHRNISPEYQKGYHKLFLPLVKYAKQKGITNKFIKNILEHIAVHSTIDMRQSLRGKRHTLGRVYRKIILPLCYWAGSK